MTWQRHVWLGAVVLLGTLLYLIVLSDVEEARPLAITYAVGVVTGFFAGRRIG